MQKYKEHKKTNNKDVPTYFETEILLLEFI
jgi:hypothetical protein